MIRPGGFIAQFFLSFLKSQDKVPFVFLSFCFVFISRVVMVSWSGRGVRGGGGFPVVFVLLPHIVQIVAV